MQRVIEPELMEDELRAKAYSDADFEAEHTQIVKLLDVVFGDVDISGQILDLGCGPGDVTFRIARKFPKANITAIDGSEVMIKIANERKILESDVADRIKFVQAMVPSTDIPNNQYDLIISTSFLHHLHKPAVLWQTIKSHSQAKTKIFVADLCRPKDKESASWIVNELANNEPEVLKEDFYNSLLAAFTLEEVERQLCTANLEDLSVYFDRYIVTHGVIE